MPEPRDLLLDCVARCPPLPLRIAHSLQLRLEGSQLCGSRHRTAGGSSDDILVAIGTRHGAEALRVRLKLLSLPTEAAYLL